uniref:Uncharacterized protein n=1 Tax=Picea glauca TaxID=3330 RepID=A0A101LV77_PICGL|nr:hypothetical protein ABT39_MTgene2065 [Picea glauca]QHR87117.1 hypothetical protein Q903MT_gene1126 [Picea sitchensis]
MLLVQLSQLDSNLRLPVGIINLILKCVQQQLNLQAMTELCVMSE